MTSAMFLIAAAGNEIGGGTSTTKAILSGGVIAIFAFALAMLGAWYRERRGRLRREEAVMAALRAEVAALRPVAQNDLDLVRHELTLLPNNQSLVNPLDPLGSAPRRRSRG